MNWRLLLIVFSYAMLATSLVFVWLTRRDVPDTDLFWSEETQVEVQERVEDAYVDPITDERAEQLFDAALHGYVRRLDEFSAYFDAEQRRILEEDTSGHFGGIGVQVRATPDGILIAAVRVGGPADHAGVHPGDVIEQVNGEPLAGDDLREMLSQVKGPPNTQVTITLRDPDGNTRDTIVTRALIPLDSVPLVRLFDGHVPVGYFRVSQFSEGTGAEIRDAVDHLSGLGARALIMDLRYNAGGVVSGAVQAASEFLPADSVICRTRGRLGGVVRTYDYVAEAPQGRVPNELPLVVLVNHESASASEILAGALQDYGRALLVGTRTYGKFLVQTLFELQSRDATVRLTTSRYETPHGRSGQRHEREGIRGGLVPDVRVRLSGDEARDSLLRRFGRDADARHWRVMEEERVADALPEDDTQLHAALELLRGHPVADEPLVTLR